MKEHGQMRTCDRCGAVVFEKHAKTTDVGFYYNYEFEPAEGWSYREEFGDLCPDCTDALKRTHEAFMQGLSLGGSC